MTRINKSKWSL